ncbi:MAG: hypothetical protein GQ531_01310 [Sulfurovum sp.]|nr:hypothetical protein [Sulfurovum sp.]
MKNLKPMMFALLFAVISTQTTFAKTKTEINKAVDIALEKFKQQVPGGENFLPKTKAYLVFPSVIKAGFIVGGKYGEGALRIDGVSQHYYDMTAASVGFQAGAQKHSMLIAFLSEASLNNFVESNGWEAGVDGTINVSDWAKSKDISSMSFEKPIIAFIYNEKGLMASLSIAGTKFRRIAPLD